ncbi:MAG: T9SS type A sorting domain-containing protein, partial [Bacteroidota bacterium]|nr:T9SS type A sorting domain-containing protein [Candidatus Kapabacteria bacterium]MDW8221027.1 T9SS type A sorting domain-containing protein [Bacteroidota bacterium]
KSYRFINAQVPDAGAAGGQSFTEHYITIVVHANGVNSLEVDGQRVPAGSFRPIANSGYVYGNFRVSGGVHTARGDSAFGIYVYGYGQANSYGYIGGGKLRVIAPDRDAPQLVLRPECFAVSGTVLDTLVTDSRLERVILTPTTLANVRLDVEPFIPFADSVRFRAELINRFADGAFILEARDSIGFVTRRTIPLYGFTVGAGTREQGQGATGAPLLVEMQVPVGRTRSVALTITNYGATTQTITDVQLALRARNVRFIGTTLPLILASGASVTLRISYFAEHDTVLTDTVRLVGICSARAIAILRIISQADRTPPTFTATLDDCGQRIILDITETEAFSSGIASITPLSLVNCTLRFDTINAERVRSLIVVNNPRQDAVYTLQLQDSAGNITTVRNIIPGFTLALVGDRASAGTFPPTSITGTTQCITLTYTNTGSQAFRFTMLAPQRNTHFSLPLSQMPISILPGATQNIIVCFAPSAEQTFLDTLILSGNCVGDTVVLRGIGFAPDLVGVSRCDVPLRMRIASTPRMALVHVHPQPASDIVALQVHVHEGGTSLNITLYDTQGIVREQVFKGTLETGNNDISFSVANIPTGMYLCVLRAGTEQIVRQIAILR